MKPATCSGTGRPRALMCWSIDLFRTVPGKGCIQKSREKRSRKSKAENLHHATLPCDAGAKLLRALGVKGRNGELRAMSSAGAVLLLGCCAAPSLWRPRITFHRSLLSPSPLTCHLPLSLLTNHLSRITATLATQSQSMQDPGVLWFMIKKWQIAIKFRVTIEELTGIIQKVSCAPFLNLARSVQQQR